MTLYLQRLLNRSAGPVLPAAPPSPTLRPALQSGSPIFSFDQRLGNADLASEYGLVGASPPEPAFPEPVIDFGAELPSGAALERRAARPAPATEPISPLAPPAATSMDSGRAPEADSPAATSAPRPRRQRGKMRPAADAPVPESESPSAYRATRSPSPAPESAIAETTVDLPAPAPVRADEAPQPRPQTAGSVPDSLPIAPIEPVEDKFTVPIDRPLREESQTTIPDREVPAPPPSVAPAPVIRPVAAAPEPARPMVRPVVVEAPPLEPPAPRVAMRDIERMVEDKVRSRLASQTAAPAQPAQTPSRETDLSAGPARKRPATAAEASRIGKLEPSAYQPMLFGVRRR